MRNLKKVLALVIAFSMMLSVVAFAGYKDVPADADYAAAVELLSALDIFEGDDLGNFNPDNTITRAEAAAVVCRTLGLENSAEGAKGITAFTDVAADHWASGYINLATQNGIINGHGDGTFAPEDPVTYEQIVKMLVCALGFEPMAAQKGGYPTGYLVVANAYKVTAGVTATIEAPRKSVAQLVANALSTPKMDQSKYGVNAEWEVLDGKNDREYATLLTDMDIYIASGIVGAKDIAEGTVEFGIRETSNDFEFGIQGIDEKKDGYAGLYDDEEFGLDLYINDTDIANYETQYVDAYVQKNSRGKYYVLAVVPSEMGQTLTVLSDDIKEVNGNKVEYYVDGTSKTKTVKFAEKVQYSLNKGLAADADYDVADLLDLADDIELKFVENTGDSSYDMIIATEYVSKRVEDIDAKNDRIKLGNRWLEVDYEDETVEYAFYAADGSELALSDFVEDDVVAIVANDDVLADATYIRIIKLTDNAVEGVVTETATQNGKDYVWINGEKYEDQYGLANEDEGTFFVSLTGKIFDFEGVSAIGNYAFILEAAKNSKAFSADVWEIKLLTAADGIVEYTLTDEASEDFEEIVYDTDDDDVADASYADLLGVDGEDWLFVDNNDDLGNAYRIITYKTNSKGEIKSFEYAEDADLTAIDDIAGIFNAKTQKIDGATMEDDTVIFNVEASKVNAVYATDVSYLVDDGEYAGNVVKVDGDVKLFIITNGQVKLSDEVGFAIVTDVRETTADGEDIYVVSYIQDMNEGKVTFNEDSEEIVGTATFDYANLDIGDVFVFNADADGIVNTYAVLGTIGEDGFFDALTDTLDEFSEDNEFIYGYITCDEDAGNSKKYETILVDGAAADEISVSEDSNTYSYYTTKRTTEIKTAYFTEDADWAMIGDDDEILETTFFFARIFEDVVMDIYTINQRVEGAEAIILEAADAVYVVGQGATLTGAEAIGVADAEDVDDAIAALPAVADLTLDDKEDVEAARDAYDALDAAQKLFVENLKVLEKAEAKIAELEAAVEEAPVEPEVPAGSEA